MNSFFALIDQLNARPEQADDVKKLIWQTFGVEKAVLALDMSGFTLSVRRDGIIAYLQRIRRMHLASLPLVPAHGGELVKCEADNLMLVFDEARHALQAAIAIRAACGEIHQGVSIGLDFGRILLIPDTDCYGDAVNLAYKLGEDLAEANEILMTDAIRSRLPEGMFPLVAQHFSISGIEFQAWRLS